MQHVLRALLQKVNRTKKAVQQNLMCSLLRSPVGAVIELCEDIVEVSGAELVLALAGGLVYDPQKRKSFRHCFLQIGR